MSWTVSSAMFSPAVLKENQPQPTCKRGVGLSSRTTFFAKAGCGPGLICRLYTPDCWLIGVFGLKQTHKLFVSQRSQALYISQSLVHKGGIKITVRSLWLTTHCPSAQGMKRKAERTSRTPDHLSKVGDSVVCDIETGWRGKTKTGPVVKYLLSAHPLSGSVWVLEVHCADQVPAKVRLHSGKGEGQHEREGGKESGPGRTGGVELSFPFDSGTLASSCVVLENNSSFHRSRSSLNKTQMPGVS